MLPEKPPPHFVQRDFTLTLLWAAFLANLSFIPLLGVFGVQSDVWNRVILDSRFEFAFLVFLEVSVSHHVGGVNTGPNHSQRRGFIALRFSPQWDLGLGLL
jgi:hypothetical protein